MAISDDNLMVVKKVLLAALVVKLVAILVSVFTRDR